MGKTASVKDTCIQSACFFLPFFESGEWRTKEKSPWKRLKKQRVTPESLRFLADYTEQRLRRCAAAMEFLLSIHDDWDVTVKKDGVWMETQTMAFEDIIPQLEAGGVGADDYELYSEYTRKWGML